MTRLVSVVIALLVCATAARADDLSATREMPLVETSHTVDIRIENGVATYTVRRIFKNSGDTADQVELVIGLPYGAAATGLRIKAKDRWYTGELMEREKAAKLYEEMTGFGQYAPKDPALLAWMWADTLSLQMFDDKEQLRSFSKSDLKEWTVINSPMPSYRDKLTPQELADVVSYLLSLKGQVP